MLFLILKMFFNDIIYITECFDVCEIWSQTCPRPHGPVEPSISLRKISRHLNHNWPRVFLYCNNSEILRTEHNCLILKTGITTIYNEYSKYLSNYSCLHDLLVWCPGQNKRIALSLSSMDVVKGG
jgi:hypothetical protein